MGDFGNHSMNMVDVYLVLLFHDLMYSLRYPLVIFVTLVVVSLLCSYFVNAVCSFITIIYHRKCQNTK